MSQVWIEKIVESFTAYFFVFQNIEAVIFVSITVKVIGLVASIKWQNAELSMRHSPRLFIVARPIPIPFGLVGEFFSVEDNLVVDAGLVLKDKASPSYYSIVQLDFYRFKEVLRCLIAVSD